MEAQRSQAFGSKATAEMYNDSIVLADTSEAVTESFIDQALTIYKRALRLPTVLSIVKRMDLLYNKASPFNHIGNMHGIIAKGRTESNIVWIFQGIADYCQSKEKLPSEFHVRFITGAGVGGKGIADVLRLKMESWS